jgi:apolipoprotein N-acyltransferase
VLSSISNYGLLIALGILQAYALASPWSGEANAWLQIIALVGFLFKLQTNNKPKQTFIQAWVFSTSWLIASVWWLYISIHHFGGLPVVLTVVAILLLCGGLAIYYALTVHLYVKLKKSHATFWSASLFASCWTLAEMARAELFTGFPWGAIGYAHVDSALVTFAPWVGVYGVGWVAAFIAACIATSLSKERKDKKIAKSTAYSLVVLLLLMVPWHVNKSSDEKNFSVSLLQGNIPQDLKYTKLREQAVQWYVKKAVQAETDLVVMPETAIPYLRQDIPNDEWQKISTHFSTGKKAIIVGIPTFEKNKGFGNSAIALQANADEYLYNKHHLVPFGEFIPTYFKWFNQMVNFGITDFIRGPLKPDPFVWNDQNIAIQICYEDLFGEELAQRFAVDQKNIPSLLVNMSNIAWFGNTVVIPQHLHIARMRSIELNRPTIRATNSGGTAIIDASGKVQAVAKPYTQTVLVGNVPASDGRVTWFTQWAGRWGLLPMWVFCSVIVVGFAVTGARLRSATQSH